MEHRLLHLETEVASLSEHLDWLQASVRRLRGKITGGLRGDPDPAGENGGPVSDAPAVQPTGYDRQFELSKLSRARDEQYARQVKGEP